MSSIQLDIAAIKGWQVPLPYPDPRGLTLEETRSPLPQQLSVECTTDMQYLNQYFFIREYVYQNDLKVKTFSGDEDAVDRRSHLIIARIGHFCIGGLRLTISTTARPEKLTLERGDFNIQDYLPHLKNHNYCDVGRVALLPQYRDSKALDKMLRLSVEIAKQHDCTYLFGASPPPLARLFQRSAREIGYRHEARQDICPPTGSENKHLRLIFQTVHLKE